MFRPFGRPASSPEASRPRRTWKSRFLRFAFLLVVGLAALVAAAPWIISSGPVKSLVVGRINAAMKPGSVVVGRWSIGWLEPARIDGLALVDPKGKQVVAARSVSTDWGLIKILSGRPNYGTITVEGAKVDVERRVDGTIDAFDALTGLTGGPTPAPTPDHPLPAPVEPGATTDRLAVRVVLKDCTLRATSPELPEPITAGKLEGTFAIEPGKPMTLDLALVDGDRTLKLDGSVGRNPSKPVADMALKVVGKDWPLRFRGDGGIGQGRFAGTIDARRSDGLWSARADANLDDFEAQGPAFRGDHPHLGRVTLAADASQASASTWAIRRLDLGSTFASVKGRGAFPPVEGVDTKVEARADLVKLARLLPNTLRIREGLTVDAGEATLSANLTGAKGEERAEVVLTVANLAATRDGHSVEVHDVPKVEIRAHRQGDKVSVEQVSARAAGVDVSGSGDLDAGLTVKGIVDLAALDAQARDWVDLGAFRMRGLARFAADYRRADDGYKARIAADCRDLTVVGATEAPITRPLVRLDATAVGPRAVDGRPDGWASAKLDVKAGDDQVDLAIGHDPDGTLAVKGLAALDLPGQESLRAETRIDARWHSDAIDFAELRAWLIPVKPGQPVSRGGENALALSARGRVDLGAGSASFEPLGDAPKVGALGLGPGGIKVSGWKAADATIRVDAGLVGDLEALDRLLAARRSSPVKGWTGPWSAKVLAARGGSGQSQFDVQMALADLLGQGAATLATSGRYEPANDRLVLDRANVGTQYGSIGSRATLDKLATDRVIDWSGTIDPKWDVVGSILAHKVEPGARIDAVARPFHLAGPLGGGTLATILPAMVGEIGIDVRSMAAFGVEVGPAPLALKLGGGQMKFEPIATTFNGGPGLIQPKLGFDKEGGLWLLLDESRIDNAAINEAVSTSLLSYVAPVLSKATEVNGKLTLVLSPEGAAFPITAGGFMRMQGVMAFNDLVFRPGPLGNEIFSVTGRTEPKLALAQPVQFSVLEGRVYQSGLSIPVGPGAKVELAGSVGFDKTLKLNASVPITSKMLGKDPNLDKLVTGLKVGVPIGGTLSHPSIDRSGLRVALRDALKTVAGRSLQDQAGKLIGEIAGPKGGAAAAGASGAGQVSGRNAAEVGRNALEGLLKDLGNDAVKPR